MDCVRIADQSTTDFKYVSIIPHRERLPGRFGEEFGNCAVRKSFLVLPVGNRSIRASGGGAFVLNGGGEG